MSRTGPFLHNYYIFHTFSYADMLCRRQYELMLLFYICFKKYASLFSFTLHEIKQTNKISAIVFPHKQNMCIFQVAKRRLRMK